MDESHAIQRIRQILGCHPPLHIQRFKVSIDARTVHVWLSYEEGALWRCAMCERELVACRGPVPERIFRCLTCEEPQTFVHVEIPYIECPEHGVQDANVPWMRDPDRWQLVASRYPIEEPIVSRVH
jgi:transposase